MKELRNLTDGLYNTLQTAEDYRPYVSFAEYIDFKLDLERLVYSLANKYEQDLGPTHFDKATFVEECGFVFYEEFSNYEFESWNTSLS